MREAVIGELGKMAAGEQPVNVLQKIPDEQDKFGNVEAQSLPCQTAVQDEIRRISQRYAA